VQLLPRLARLRESDEVVRAPINQSSDEDYHRRLKRFSVAQGFEVVVYPFYGSI
jgi:hypothetical protein